MQFMDFPEPERQLWLQWRCHVRHNLALIRAREKQVKCINQLLALACGLELTSSLEQRLQLLYHLGVNQHAAAAVLCKVSSRTGGRAKPCSCWKHMLAASRATVNYVPTQQTIVNMWRASIMKVYVTLQLLLWCCCCLSCLVAAKHSTFPAAPGG
jgi:hypothetical protein